MRPTSSHVSIYACSSVYLQFRTLQHTHMACANVIYKPVPIRGLVKTQTHACLSPHTLMHACMHACMYTCMSTRSRMRTYMHIDIDIYVFQIYIYIDVCMYVCMHACI